MIRQPGILSVLGDILGRIVGQLDLISKGADRIYRLSYPKLEPSISDCAFAAAMQNAIETKSFILLRGGRNCPAIFVDASTEATCCRER